ncbi:MAG: hypothetical protein LBC73_10235 [Oscillospiraceae bacterium]|jgi:FtsZ-interacting cell division protein ZipA|nr:hypothetical protein [Oscillospiraceae bacterium]
MGIEHYAFALFIAILICVVAIIFKILFADVKRQKKLLDEKESQILQLYTSVETLMEEFTDQAKATVEELRLKEHEYRAISIPAAFDLPPALEEKEQILERVPRSVPYKANQIRAVGEVIERAERYMTAEAPPIMPTSTPTPPLPIYKPPVQTVVQASAAPETRKAVFQKFFDDSMDAPPPPPPVEITTAQERNEAVLSLAAEGKDDIEIASQLGITRNEVQLVRGLAR